MNISSEVVTIVDRGLSINHYQVKDEMLQFAQVIYDKKPKVVLEIGSFCGATLTVFAMCATDDAILIGIDSNTSNFNAGFVQSCMKSRRLYVVEGDSKEVVGRIREILGETQVDLLFIDGDHSYSSVYFDYVLYRPFVSPGGIIAFHDVCVQNRLGAQVFYGTDVLFEQIKQVQNCNSIICSALYLPRDSFEAAGIGYFYNDVALPTRMPINMIHFLWLGSRVMSLAEYVAIATAGQVNSVRPILWIDSEVVSNNWLQEIQKIADVRLLDVNILGGCKLLSLYHKIDYIRYHIMWEYGGLFLDLDTVSVKPFAEIINDSEFILGYEDVRFVCSAVMYTAGPHQVDIGKLKARCISAMGEVSAADNGALGPKLITTYLEEESNTCAVVARSAFYHYKWDEQEKIFEDNELRDDMYIIHWWSFRQDRRAEITREYIANSNSLYAKAVRASGVKELYQ